MIKVEKHLHSRLLYCNPVCLLTTVYIPAESNDLSHDNDRSILTNNPDATKQPLRNIMTCSWLTPLDNASHFILSLKSTRYTVTDMLARTDYFVLNIPVTGMEDLVLKVGAVSGRDGDKIKELGVDICLPGGNEIPAIWPWCNNSDKKRGKPNAKNILPPLIAVKSCAAHLICKVESRIQKHNHDVLFGVIEQAYVLPQFWNGKQFGPLNHQATDCVNDKQDSNATFLSFMGSQRFSYNIPAC